MVSLPSPPVLNMHYRLNGIVHHLKQDLVKCASNPLSIQASGIIVKDIPQDSSLVISVSIEYDNKESSLVLNQTIPIEINSSKIFDRDFTIKINEDLDKKITARWWWSPSYHMYISDYKYQANKYICEQDRYMS